MRILRWLWIGAAFAAGPVFSQAIEEPSIWKLNFKNMFQRDKPRSFARSPEDNFIYLSEGNGLFTQLNVTTVWQKASDSLTARVDPSDNSLRKEAIIEVFYRILINNFVTVTPDLQFIIDPANNPTKDRITVVGLRLQLDF